VEFVLQVQAIDRGDGWESRSGRALVYANPPPDLVTARDAPHFRYGDGLELQGTLFRPEPVEGFDYAAYLSSQGITGVFWSRRVEWRSQGEGYRWQGWLFSLRRQVAQGIERSLPVPQSAVAQALLLGLRGPLPPAVVEQFRNTGTAHLLAISGLHVGVLLALTLTFGTMLLGRRRQLYLLLPLGSIWFYALISGMPPSVVRAAVMGTLYLAALGLGRPRTMLPALAGSALLMTAWDPKVLTQLSFQLSFLAMAGIILALPHQSELSARLNNWFHREGAWWVRWSGQLLTWLAGGLLVSVAATLATLPLVAITFGQIPLFGIPVTLLALPVLPFILGGAALTGVFGAIHPLLGQPLGWVAWVPLSYLLFLVSAAPDTTVSGSWIGPPLAWGWYLTLGGLLLLGGRGRRLWQSWRLYQWSRVRLERDNGVTGAAWSSLQPTSATVGALGLILLLGTAAALLWGQLLSGPDGRLHVYFLEVGQGDSTLIVTPGGRQVLIDGGPEIESATTALADPLPFWDRSLDLVALTHLDADHSRGLLAVLDRYHVSAALVGVEDRQSSLYPQWRAALDRSETRVIPLARGYRVTLEEGVTLEVLHPSNAPFAGTSADANNNGLVLRLVHGEVSFLLTGDIEAVAERQLVAGSGELRSQVLKVGHHGSDTSTTPEFLRRVNPTLAVISAGVDNNYGHPSPRVVARLVESLGEEWVYQTALQGTVEVISDGVGLQVVTER